MKPGDRHAHKMDAYHYWRQFPVHVHWDEPIEVVGTLEAILEQKTPEGTIPRLKIRADDGTLQVVLAAQTRLMNELIRQAPIVGDRIKIAYLGEADRAAPGMSRSKAFKVAVRRMDREPERPGEDAPAQAPENAPAPTEEAAS